MKQLTYSPRKNLKNRMFSVFENRFWDGFLHLFFPSNCLCCEGELLPSELSICKLCTFELPFTLFELAEEPTDLDQLFWGRVEVTSTYAMLYYEKINTVKPILEAIKYKGRSDTAQEFGRLLGEKISQMSIFKNVDCLVPVPIHPKKRYVRGYNQSEEIAKGIQQIVSIPINTKLVNNRKHTGSQTKLGRFVRWDNVTDKFFGSKQLVSFNHIAIVDDVVTTGATLESLIRSIRELNPKIRISVISLAVTK